MRLTRLQFLIATVCLLSVWLGALLYTHADPAAARQQDNPVISFGSGTLTGAEIEAPTVVQFGPDGRLYVAELRGNIKALSIERTAANEYRVTDSETISHVRSIPNYNDDGTPTDIPFRQMTGMFVTGTAENPVIYATSSDPRLAYDETEGLDVERGGDTNSGVVSRLTWDGADWQHLELVRGLPRSVSNHSVNGVTYDAANNRLFVAQGGHTNMGAPADAKIPLMEYALSAAILSVDLNAIGESTYDLPTLANTDLPFGGQQGLNQAVIDPDGPVQVYAPGFRNPYDILLTDDGRLLSIDNGPNANWGNVPVAEGSDGACLNDINANTSDSYPDGLHLITPGYYAGHPNPTRANMENTFDGRSPIPAANPVECDFLIPGEEDGALITISDPTTGFTMYTASNFGGALTGDLLVTGWEGGVTRIDMTDDGMGATSTEKIFENFGNRPIDLTTQGDEAVFPGTVWVAALARSEIQVFEPIDYEGASVNEVVFGNVYDVNLDDDGDGYSNADEIDNRTLTYSAASIPPDVDGDLVSDLNDTDDDNDGIADELDPFALDPANGTATELPVRYSWASGDPGTGLFGLGFTGLMTNGKQPYHQLYDAERVIAGGAWAKTSIIGVPSGDATGSQNDQMYGFQFGVKVDANMSPFTVRTQLEAPYFNGETPTNSQSQGVYIGTGDQDNYVKLVMNANDGQGGFEVVMEDRGEPTIYSFDSSALEAELVEVFLTVDPTAGTVQPGYATTENSATLLGAALPLPENAALRDMLTSGEQGLAVGIIATSLDANPFTATWRYLDVQSGVPETSGVIEPTRITPEVAANPENDVTALVPQQQDALPQAPMMFCGWERVADAPINRYEPSTLVAGGKVYLLGGFINPGLLTTDAVSVYDPATNTWTETAPMPMALTHHHGLVVEDREIWVFGGAVGANPGRIVDNVWIYDIASDEWREGPSLPEPVGGGGVALNGRDIHYFGGMITDRATSSEDHWVYNLDSADGWQNRAPMTRARLHFSTALIDGKIYAFGGQFGHDRGSVDLPYVEVYDIASDTWSELGDMPQAISHAEGGTFMYNGMVYIGGGRNRPFAEALSSIYAYDPTTDTWSRAGALPEQRIGASMRIIDDRLITSSGGLNWFDPRSTTWISQPAEACTPPLPFCINTGGVAVTTDQRPFAQDQFVTGGQQFINENLPEPQNAQQGLFLQQRTGVDGEGFSYNIPLAPGQYRLNMFFAETLLGTENAAATGQRLIDVTVEGEPLVDNLNVLEQTGGALQTLQTRHDLNINDGTMNLAFSSEGENPPMLAGLCLSDPNAVDAAPALDLSVQAVVTAYGLVNVDAIIGQEDPGNLTYIWDFGNGFTTQGNPNLQYYYEEPGTYTISVTATDNFNTETASVNVIVHAPPAGAAEALVQIDPPPSPNPITTTDPGAFKILNISQGGQQITSLRFDVTTAFLPNLMFDVSDAGGDNISQEFTPGIDDIVTVTDFRYSQPYHGGFRTMTVDFADFAPNDFFTFSADVDPSSIFGTTAPGPGDAGSIDGIELIGTKVTVTFDDGTTLTGRTYRIPGSRRGSQVTFQQQTNLTAPTMEIPNYDFIAGTASTRSQTILVYGNPGDVISVVYVEGGQFVAPDADHDFLPEFYDANNLNTETIGEQVYTMGPEGVMEVNLALASTSDQGGLNYMISAKLDDFGRPGPASRPLILKLDESPEE